jgi:two-component system chemotaxis response regulator CheY
MSQKTQVKILIVDDNDLMRTLLRGILRNEEYQIVGEAKNGVIAVEMSERFKPDIICMDVMMPEMDGLEALQTIKAAHPQIRVVMVTGNPSVENVREAIQNGASGFIVKPFNAAKVLDTLNRALQTASHPPVAELDPVPTATEESSASS